MGAMGAWASEQVTRIMSNVEPVIMSFCFSEVPAIEHQRGSLALCLHMVQIFCVTDL